MSNSYREQIVEQLDEIENAIYDIIEHCKSGKYSIDEIADELAELRGKVY